MSGAVRPNVAQTDLYMDVTYCRDRLFPSIQPYQSGTLDVGGQHVLYWEQSGNPRGTPVVFLHGGPGAGASPTHRRFFDPDHYRIIIFDQRGCGRSKPYAEVRENTTAHLVADLEALRRLLGVDRWILFGGSWGSTLALAYCAKWQERCAGLILRGVFFGTRREVDWFLFGMSMFFPEAHRDFVSHLPEEERHDVLAGYYRRLTDPDPCVHGPAALHWAHYESTCSNLLPRPVAGPIRGGDISTLALARIEAHYFTHDLFLPEGYIVNAIQNIGDVPATIVQGRYDMICPPVTADVLARRWPHARNVVVPAAGHSALEPGIVAALVQATEGMKSL